MSLLNKVVPFTTGFIMSINFLLFWAGPIFAMGLLWKHILRPVLLPIYDVIDGCKAFREFGAKYIYTNPIHTDYFAASVLLLINATVSISTVFYVQFKYGFLPYWLIGLYYCLWVGIGGRMMGAAYALSHKEGHNQTFYRPWIRNTIGHPFENVFGLFYGNVPWNFSTSHIFIHHMVDGGAGDTFYLWDFDRTNLAHFMLYVYRILMHMTGVSSLNFFYAHNQIKRAELLTRGVYIYWGFCIFLLLITQSLSFVFWIYLQPMFCMTYFLALINIGFHGFLDFDENGEHLTVVDATCIVKGDDDYFGEDDHMAHHYNPNVYYRDLPALQHSKEPEFSKHHGSVFKEISIVELSIYILFQVWDRLADHYVDYTGKMTKEEIMHMLKVRCQRIEFDYDKYQKYLEYPSMEARHTLREECKKAKRS